MVLLIISTPETLLYYIKNIITTPSLRKNPSLCSVIVTDITRKNKSDENETKKYTPENLDFQKDI